MARKIEVELVGDSRSLERALGRAQGAGSKFGKVLGVGLKAAAAVGAAGIAGLAVATKIGVSEFLEAQKVAAQTNAVLKSTGRVANVSAKDVTDLAEALMKKTGVDDEAIASGQNLLLTFTNIRNEVGKGNGIFTQATKLILDMSVAMGTDMKSATILVGKALNDPIRGLTALRRVGVAFNDAQEKTIAGLIESGKEMKAQKLILAELRKEFGGSARAAGKTLAGQINILRESFNNWAGDMVSRVMPAFQEFLRRFNRAKGFTAKLRIVWTGVREAAEDLLELLGNTLFGSIQRTPLKLDSGKIIEWQTTEQKGLIQSIQDGLRGADWTAIGRDIGSAISERVKITAEFMNNTLQAVSSWIDSHIGQLADLGAKLLLAVINKLLDPAFWKENWRLILGVAVAVFPIGRFATLGGRIGGAIGRGILNLLPTLVGVAVLETVKVLGRILGFLSGPLRAMFGRIPGWLTAAFKISIVQTFVERTRQLFDSVREKVGQVVTFIREQWNRLPAIVRQLIGPFLSVISTVQRLVNLIREAINAITNLASGIRNLPGVGAVSGLVGKIPGLQHGGMATAGRPFIVGERGPELFIPTRSGRVVPNGGAVATAAAGGSYVILADQAFVNWLQGLDGRYRRGNGGRGILGG